jgi:hypothetical protein
MTDVDAALEQNILDLSLRQVALDEVFCQNHAGSIG